MAAHKLLDLLVRLIHARQALELAGAHGGLDRLAKHLPVLIQLTLDDVGVRVDGLKATHEVGQGEQGVAERGTDVALGGRIGQIALPTGFHQRGGEGVEQRAADLEVGFGVLETNRVDLVRHGGGTSGTLDRHLGEHAAGDVHPHVHAQVVHDAVGVGDGGVQLGLPVVAFDLRGQRVPGQAHAVRDEFAGDGDPVDIRACGQVGTERAGRAVDLAQVLLVFDVLELTVQTVDVDGELLAERGRRGRLAVGEGEQRHILEFLGLAGEVVDDALELRGPHVFHRVLDATGDGEVVDVFGRAGEVHEGLQLVVDVGQLGRSLVDLIIDVVLHGLHIVVGDGLMSGVLLDAFGAEVLGNGAQEGLLFGSERLDAVNDRLVAVALKAVGQKNHPFDFDTHAFAVQGRFAHVFDERGGGLVITAVERGQCDCGGNIGKLHNLQGYFQP